MTKSSFKKKEVIAALLDVHGAFDNINIDILLVKLSQVGCPNSVLKYIKFLTYERIIHTDYLGEEIRVVHKGVPQGGVLSPLLFILYIAGITLNLPNNIQSKNLIQKAVNKIGNNLLNLGLDLTPSKSVLLHFNNKNVEPGSIDIKINNTTIQSSNSARFLGIILDYKMSFTSQVNAVEQKCKKTLNILKFLCGT